MEDSQSPSYKEDAFIAFIPFANKEENNFTKDMRFNIQIPKYHGYRGPKPVYEHNPPMDTGSTGLAISACDLGYTVEEQLQEYEKGKEYLSSSRIYYEGYWVPTKVTFPDGNIRAEVKILAVTFAAVCLNFNETTGNCDHFSDENHRGRRSHFPPDICYMGVGFGRLSMQQPGGTADRNPFLNVVETNDGMTISKSNFRQGYVITKTGMWIGLAESNTRDFRFTKLSANPEVRYPAQPQEWNGTSVFIDHGNYENMKGIALFDTGINQSYLSAPAFQEVRRLPPGEKYTIKIGNQANMPTESLHITVDDFTNPITPAYVRVSPREATFVNTGRFFYRSFDLLLDAEDGWLGLRRRPVDPPVMSQPLVKEKLDDPC